MKINFDKITIEDMIYVQFISFGKDDWLREDTLSRNEIEEKSKNGNLSIKDNEAILSFDKYHFGITEDSIYESYYDDTCLFGAHEQYPKFKACIEAYRYLTDKGVIEPYCGLSNCEICSAK